MVLENNYRYVILFIGFFCLASVCSNYIVINFTFICMKNDMSDTYEYNGTVRSIYDYTSDEKKQILWAVAAGTIIGTMPINVFYVKFGARYPFLVAGIFSALSTALIPYAAKTNMLFLLFLRFVQGLAYSADFAAIGLMTVRWAPLAETAFFIATLTCFTGISSMVTNSVTGLICESSLLGWKHAFYYHAAACLFFFLLWAIFYVDDPQDTKKVSQKELTRIHRNKSAAHLDKKTKVPYLKIVTSPVIICVWLNAFFEMSAIIMFTTYMPIYFHNVLKFGVAETGFYVGFVIGINIPVRLVTAMMSDKITFIPEKWKIYIFNSISVGISGLLLASIGLIPAEERMLSFIMFLACMHCMALNSGGFYKSGALHARQFAHVVIAAIQFMKCLALFSAPALVAFFVTDDSNRIEWIPVFMTLGGAMFLANMISFFFFTDKPADWTDCEPKVYKQVAVDETKC